ncbi:MAG: M48 family metallopeptidase [Actinomycetota bacterium]
MNLYRRYPARAPEWFGEDEIRRAAAYRRPLRRAGLLQAILGLGVNAAVVATAAGPRLAGVLEAGDWRLGTVLVASGLTLASGALGLPFSAWRQLVHERRWGFNRQSPGGFLADAAKSVGLSLVFADVAVLGLWALMRTTRWWWLAGWVGAVILMVLLGFLAPVALAPIFNRFRPLGDAELVGPAEELSRRAGVRVSQFLVMDASRRTAKHNAYFSGLGRTKRVVLSDTLLKDFDRSSILVILAHELGHWRRRHVPLGIVGASALMLPGFLILYRLLAWEPIRDWAGIDGAGDPGSVPLVVLALSIMQAAVSPLQLWVSRAWERRADLDAVELTGDPASFVRMERELALKNLSELAPGRLGYLLASHPPAPERIALATAAAPQRHRSRGKPHNFLV